MRAPSAPSRFTGVCDTSRTPFICDSCLAISSGEGMLLLLLEVVSPPII